MGQSIGSLLRKLGKQNGLGALVGTLSIWPFKKEQFGLQAPSTSVWVLSEQHFQA